MRDAILAKSPDTLYAIDPRGDGEINADACLQSVRDELVSIALLTCVTANIALALERQSHGLRNETLRSYLPPQPTAYPIFLHSILATMDADHVIRELQSFYDQIELLRSLTSWYCTALDHYASQLPIDLFALTAIWQGASAQARTALTSLAALQASAPDAIRRDEENKLSRLLDDVINGDITCLDERGCVVASIPMERRERSRLKTARQVYVELNDSIQRALVIDAGALGVGLWGLRNATVGGDVRVIIRPGVTIGGRIIWVNETRCGIQLVEPLPPQSDGVSELITIYDA